MCVMKRSKLNILFYMRNNRVNKSGKKSLMIRITIEDQKVPITPDIEVDPQLWDSEQKRMIGKSYEAILVNNQIEDVKVQLRKIHEKLNETGVSTPKKIKSIFTQKDKVALIDNNAAVRYMGREMLDGVEYRNGTKSIGIDILSLNPIE